MLRGSELGAAIDKARLLKRVSKTSMAAHFGVKPPSITIDWVEGPPCRRSMCLPPNQSNCSLALFMRYRS